MSWTSKSVGRMQHRQQLRAGQAALNRAQARLHKTGRRQWPFQPGEVKTVSDAIFAAAVAKIGPIAVAEIEAEIGKLRASGELDKVRSLGDLEKLAAPMMAKLAKHEAEDAVVGEATEKDDVRAQVRAVEAAATGLIANLRKRGVR